MSTFTGNTVSKVSGNSLVSVAQSDAATQALGFVKDQVSNFVQHSKVLMNVLDEVGKAHPFIQSERPIRNIRVHVTYADLELS